MTEINVDAVIDFLSDLKSKSPDLMKAELEELLGRKFHIKKPRSVFVDESFAIRFSEVRGHSTAFSNVVLSLSALRNFDDRPFVVAIVRPNSLEFRLANTTFLKKISHSSHTLSLSNIKGSFLGHDIMSIYNQIPNTPKYFDLLFNQHRQIGWDKNIKRLVETTSSIEGVDNRFLPSKTELDNIYSCPAAAAQLIKTAEFQSLTEYLDSLVSQNASDILSAALDDNINTRGNSIEQIVTKGLNKHGIDDLQLALSSGDVLKIDIKTKIVGRSSSPKGFNIDKLLRELAKPKTHLFYFFIFIDRERSEIRSSLVNLFDSDAIRLTKIQHHWSGRNSRGTTQLTGDISLLAKNQRQQVIDLEAAQELINSLLSGVIK